ncbi:hypothetical protein CERSUDRAFT_123842 [Gelatoporia subvermispora B]|uniref:NACHT domain-containing protein n=1 Tax=Ceriporiopsis subvermispora (strain B) TaxID=914234 RepID=M2PKH5_CERS8|nr:hypothetical protein CERSUDRAFT_123842 [Gelatoporia subvermispora B]
MSQGQQRAESANHTPQHDSQGLELPRSRLEVLLTSAKGTLGIASDVASDIPVPGLAHVFSVLEQVLKRVEKMRANKQEAKDAVSSIKALHSAVQTSANSLRSEAIRLKPSEYEAAKHTLSTSDALKDRIESLSNELNDIQHIAASLTKRRRFSKFVYTDQDADLLKQIRTRVDEARENFKLQGGIALEDLLREICYRLQRTEHDRLLRDYSNDLGKLNPADASYRSSLTDEKSRLQAGTRENILRDLTKWATEECPAHRILVLHGRAGMGKSSIIHALVRSLDERRRGVTFFFNRGVPECSDAHRVIPTIAHQLAYSQQCLVALVAEATRDHLPRSRSQALQHQLEDLVYRPLSHLPASTPPILLALDGVDECLNSQNNPVPRLLELLCGLASRLPFLRVLIATRPETYIMDTLYSFQETSQNVHIDFRDLQREPGVDEDIRVFISARVGCNILERPTRCQIIQRPATIRGLSAKRGRFALLEERPDAVERLTDLADGLFIYASTVLRFLILDKHQAVKIFDALLESQGRLGPESNRMYRRLDMLYGTILDNAFGELKAEQERMAYIHRTLCWLVLQRADGVSLDPPYITVKGLALLGIPTYITFDVLDRLRSVLEVDGEITEDTELRTCHASFPQYLSDSARCTEFAFYIEMRSGLAMMVTCLLNFIESDVVNELGDADATTRWIWRYAILAWDKHLLKAEYTTELDQALRRFAGTHLDQWLACSEPWGELEWSQYLMVDLCRGVRDWCQGNCKDQELVSILTKFIDERVEVLQDPTSDGAPKRKKGDAGDDRSCEYIAPPVNHRSSGPQLELSMYIWT